MTKILAVGSPKGGVGKTTVAVHMAKLADELGLTTLLVDSDVNASALNWYEHASEEAMPFDVAAATGDQAAHLADLRRGRRYQVTVVDLPGAREGAFATMLRGAEEKPVPDLLLVPVRPRMMDLRPVIRVVHREVIPLELPYLIVLTMVRPQSVHIAEERREQLVDQGLTVAETIIREYQPYDTAHETDRTVFDLPGKRSRARYAEDDQRSLGYEVYSRLGLAKGFRASDRLSRDELHERTTD